MTIVSKKTVGLVLITAGVFVTSLAMAAGNVANTKHNFSIGGGTGVYQSTTISEVCIFCHTPHNAGQARLLWNKASNAAPNFRMYTSSGTLTTVTRTQSAFDANSPSLLCLSCHDGKTAMNVLHTSGTGITAAAAGLSGYPAGSRLESGAVPLTMPGPAYDFFTGTFAPSMNLGRAADGSNDLQGDNLTDDHPIGFSYSDVLAERPAASGGLRTMVNVNSAANANGSIRFFGTKNKVECSTCHDPHVDYSASGNPLLKPFLVMDNSGSKMCLSCHDK